MFLTFVFMTTLLAVLLWLGFNRVTLHLRDNPEATRAVVEHVLIPLFGRKEEPPFKTELDGTPKGVDAPPAKDKKKP
jgi:hypothetical protein